MKKILLLSSLLLITIFSGSAVVVYADTVEAPEESVVETVEVVEEVDIAEIEEYTAKITTWVVSTILGILGTTGVAVLFRKQLKGLITKILSAIGVLNTKKDEFEEQVKEIISSAKSVLASVEKVGNKIIEDTKEEMNALRNDFNLLCTAMSYLVCGMQELVSNGTSEDVCNMLKDFNKEVENNASKEI